VCFVACLTLAAAALVRVHNRQWNPYDDGTYLHLADRVAHGEVLNRDVQDIHLGYITFANAGALRLFGNDAVSLRYPLVAMGVANAALAFWLLAGAGTAHAVVASLAVTALSYVQFMNPSAHWYALFLTLATLAAMAWLPRRGAGRHVCVGFLVGLVVLFRQLTGAFVAAPVLLYLLLELPQVARGRQAWLGRGVIAALGAGVTLYLVRKTDVVALLMYGVWPVAIMLWAATRLAASNRDVVRTLGRFALGGVVGALPLVAYHLHHGSVRPWLHDTVFGAFSLTRLDFIDDLKYWMNMAGGANALLHPRGLGKTLVAVFWLTAPVLPMGLGAAVAWSFWEARGAGEGSTSGDYRSPPAPLPLVAVFYFLVALHYQKWLYFFFAVPLTVAGLLALVAAARPAFRQAVLVLVAVLSVIAFLLIAGPFRRLMPGSPAPLIADHGVPRCSIWLDPALARVYRDVMALVGRETSPDDAILALPVHPELYYLTGRRNPTPFYNAALALRDEADVKALEAQFERSAPKLVFFNPTNHYTTPPCRALMDWVARHYEAVGTFGVFETYRHLGRAPAKQAIPRAEGNLAGSHKEPALPPEQALRRPRPRPPKVARVNEQDVGGDGHPLEELDVQGVLQSQVQQ
jgi:hypothetical protein